MHILLVCPEMCGPNTQIFEKPAIPATFRGLEPEYAKKVKKKLNILALLRNIIPWKQTKATKTSESIVWHLLTTMSEEYRKQGIQCNSKFMWFKSDFIVIFNTELNKLDVPNIYGLTGYES